MCPTEPLDGVVFCGECKRPCRDPWYEVMKTHERVRFYDDGRLPAVEIRDTKALRPACSPACAVAQIQATMAKEGVPLPAKQPGIGPKEACARCRGPVNMADFHVAYSSAKLRWLSESSASVLACQYLAVLCPSCGAAVQEAHTAVGACAAGEIERTVPGATAVDEAVERLGASTPVLRTQARGRTRS